MNIMKTLGKLDWSDLSIILAICRSGTLSGAANALDLNHSTVFRKINAIESKFGVRFFDRVASGYIMTEAGEIAMHSAERIDTEIHSLTRELMGKDLRLQGTIRVTAPEGLSLVLLNPMLADYNRLHPDIHIDLIVTGSALRLSRREADVAIRVTKKPPDISIGRRIGHFRFAIYASYKYLKENPQLSQEDNIDAYRWLLTDDSRDWFSSKFWKKLGNKNIYTTFSSNSTMAILNACKNNMGVAPLPCFLGDSQADLVRVIEPQDDFILDLWLLTHPDLRQTARVKSLMNFLQESFNSNKDLLEGNI